MVQNASVTHLCWLSSYSFMLILRSSSRNMQCQTCAGQRVMGKEIQLHGKRAHLNWISNQQQMWFRCNLIFLTRAATWFIPRRLSVVHTSSLNHIDPAISICLFFAVFVLTISFQDTSPPASSTSLPSPLPFAILFIFFHPCPPKLFLPSFWILPVSLHVYSSLCPPLPLSNPFKPFQTLPPFPALLWLISSIHALRMLPPGSSPLLKSPPGLSQLTQQDDDAQQDGNQSPRAETGRGEECFSLAHPDPAVALARAHPQSQGAGAAKRRLPTVPHHDGQLVQLLGQVVEAPPPGNDAGSAVCNEKRWREISPLG